MARDIDGERWHPLESFNRCLGEERAVGVKLEQKALADGGFIDLEKLRVHENIATRQIEPCDAQLLHLIEQAMDFTEGQLARKEFPAVIRICVAMAAMEVAAIGQFELRLDHALLRGGLFMDSLAERPILNRRNGSLVRHDGFWAGAKPASGGLSIHRQRLAGLQKTLFGMSPFANHNFAG